MPYLQPWMVLAGRTTKSILLRARPPKTRRAHWPGCAKPARKLPQRSARRSMPPRPTRSGWTTRHVKLRLWRWQGMILRNRSCLSARLSRSRNPASFPLPHTSPTSSTTMTVYMMTKRSSQCLSAMAMGIRMVSILRTATATRQKSLRPPSRQNPSLRHVPAWMTNCSMRRPTPWPALR